MTLVQLIATKWVERERALGLKGKTADRACLEFFCGAATLAEEMQHPGRNAITATTALLIATRGAFEARRIAAEAAAEPAETATA